MCFIATLYIVFFYVVFVYLKQNSSIQGKEMNIALLLRVYKCIAFENALTLYHKGDFFQYA